MLQILLALVAAVHAEAEAEADPALLYAGYYGYPYYYGLAGYYGHNNLGLPAIKAAPCVNAAGAPVPCAGRKRREAESEADPQLVTYTNGAVAPVKTLAVQQAEAAHFAAKGLGYAYGVGTPVLPYTYTYPVVYGRKRREAEADPNLVVYPDGAVTPQKTPAVQAAEAAHYATKGLNYAYGVGLPVAPYATYTYGLPLVYGRKRREAESEAEADPAYFYAGYPYYGYGGLVHTSHFGVCLNYLGQQVSC